MIVQYHRILTVFDAQRGQNATPADEYDPIVSDNTGREAVVLRQYYCNLSAEQYEIHG